MTGEPGVPAHRDPITVSVVFQMGPLWRIDQPGVASPGDLASYAEQLAGWLVRNLQGFTEPRGADLFLTVVATRDGEHAGHEYRDGRYLAAGTSTDGANPRHETTHEREEER